MPTGAELGLEPAGAVDVSSQLPSDVMEPPAFAFAGDSPPLALEAPGFLTAPMAGQPGGVAGVAAPPAPAPAAPAPAQQVAVEQAQQTQAVAHIQAQLASVERDAQLALATLVAQGMPQAQALEKVTTAGQLANAELQRQLMEVTSMPAVTAWVAQDIAKRFSLPGSPISADDLRGEKTVSGMQARARAIQDTRRSTASQARYVSRADVVESPPGPSGGVGGGQPQANVSPFMMIRSGLSRRSGG